MIVFTDDDCYPHPDFLRHIEETFADSGALGFVGGRVVLHDPMDFPITIRETVEYERFDPGSFMRAGAVLGANFVFRRSTLEAINGFDEMFGAGALFACEDVDALGRALALGWSGVYNPDIMVEHHHQRRGASVMRLAREYTRGRGAYYAKALLNPRQRATYAKNWYWSVRRQPWQVSLRELTAGCKYLLYRLGEYVSPHPMDIERRT